MNKVKFIFAGGGTGGHLFPAVAIAEEIKMLLPQSEIMFIGNRNKIEGKIVPQYGYEFKNINISGFSRKINFSNLIFPFKLLVAILKSLFYILKFKPKAVIGTGGYVSGPVLWSANLLGITTILQDHNSYPGVTTRLLAKNAKEIHLAFDDAKKYFKREDNIKISGFPIRREMIKCNKEDSLKFFGCDLNKKTIFITGGSQGAKKINDALAKIVLDLVNLNIQIIWQTGSLQYNEIRNKFGINESIKVLEFIGDMNKAYSACDIAITRAGATTIGELLNLEVPAILIPLPTAAEDHQMKNALSLSKHNAAIVIPEDQIDALLKDKILTLINDENKLNDLKSNLRKLQVKDSAKKIAESIIKLINNN
mgnify:FL=1